MGTILIDKLLHTVVNRGASDLHLSVGQPPVVRTDGRLIKLETKVLDAEDTVALMKSITPERCQQELQEVGGTDFGFAFGELARFRVSIFKQKGNVLAKRMHCASMKGDDPKEWPQWMRIQEFPKVEAKD